jgi:hypothetical protein
VPDEPAGEEIVTLEDLMRVLEGMNGEDLK